MVPPPSCAAVVEGAAAAAHRISAQAPRFALGRLSRKLLRPLFGLWPTGLADGLAPEERRYHRHDPADSPPRGMLRHLANGSPVHRAYGEAARRFGRQ